MHLECKVNNKTFLLSGIYVSPNFEHRKLLWNTYIDLAPLLIFPVSLLEITMTSPNPLKNLGWALPILK